MVTGGKGPEKRFKKGLTSVELLLINGTRLCALPDLPVDRWEHSQTGPITCGGGNSNSQAISCVKFSGGTWQQTHTMGQPRHGHTAWVSPRGGVWLMGGLFVKKGEFDTRTSTELLNDDGSTTASFNLDNQRR